MTPLQLQDLFDALLTLKPPGRGTVITAAVAAPHTAVEVFWSDGTSTIVWFRHLKNAQSLRQAFLQMLTEFRGPRDGHPVCPHVGESLRPTTNLVKGLLHAPGDG
jgi:hypothetical protein